MKSHIHCEVCDVDYAHKDLVKRGCFVVYMLRKNQLSDVHQRPNVASKLDKKLGTQLRRRL